MGEKQFEEGQGEGSILYHRLQVLASMLHAPVLVAIQARERTLPAISCSI